jgi:hypothetical protein
MFNAGASIFKSHFVWLAFPLCAAMLITMEVNFHASVIVDRLFGRLLLEMAYAAARPTPPAQRSHTYS